MIDLFFEKNYGKLYEKLENGNCEIFDFNHKLGSVQHLFIKRKIPIQLNDEEYFDIVTPYGYGGPVITECDEAAREELVNEFSKAFQEYCSSNNIVSEFIRFHPILNNAEDFSSCYDVRYLRETVGTNLRDFEDPVQEEFSKSTKKSLRKALKAGVEYRVTVKPESLQQFKEIYYANMERIHADSYYFFGDAYFDDCIKYFGNKIVLVEAVFEGETIGMEMHFHYNNMIHTHLSGTIDGVSHLSPVYVMTYGAAEWGKENGVDFLHAGGGLSNSPEDTLYLFKKRFGKNTSFKFYTGRKVWNEKIYKELCELVGADETEEFFPAYRAKSVLETSGV